MTQNTTFKGNKNNNQKRKLPYIKARIDKLVDVDDCTQRRLQALLSAVLWQFTESE